MCTHSSQGQILPSEVFTQTPLEQVGVVCMLGAQILVQSAQMKCFSDTLGKNYPFVREEESVLNGSVVAFLLRA